MLTPVARSERRVEYIADARLPQRSGSGEKRHLMRRSVKQISVGPEDFLRTVAVMHVEIDDGNALRTMLGASVMGSNRDVVEQAETHRPKAFRVMSWWTHLAKRVRRLAAHHKIDGVEPRANRTAGSFPRSRRYDRIAVDIPVAALDMLGDFADLPYMLLEMRQRDVCGIVLAQRCCTPHKRAEIRLEQSFIDHSHTIGPLGMPHPVSWLRNAGCVMRTVVIVR